MTVGGPGSRHRVARPTRREQSNQSTTAADSNSRRYNTGRPSRQCSCTGL